MQGRRARATRPLSFCPLLAVLVRRDGTKRGIDAVERCLCAEAGLGRNLPGGHLGRREKVLRANELSFPQRFPNAFPQNAREEPRQVRAADAERGSELGSARRRARSKALLQVSLKRAFQTAAVD